MIVKNQNWISLTAIQVGGAICLPVLMLGFELSRQVGLMQGLFSIVVGNGVLFLLSLVGASMSAESEKTTAENAELFLGKSAKALFALIIATTMCFWFSIQSQMMAQDLLASFELNISEGVMSFMITCVIVVSALYGIQSIERLANIAVPFMVLTMFVALYKSYVGSNSGTVVTPAIIPQTLGSSGISLVLAASVAAVVDMPTFFRHALNKREAMVAAFVTFLVGIPLVEALGTFLGAATEKHSLVEALYCFDNPLWSGWVLIFILLAGWTTNNANLYSAAMSVRVLLPSLSDKVALIVLGALAAAFSFCDILSHLSLYLNIMGVVVASMGGVVFSGYILRRTAIALNMLALSLGIVGGLICQYRGGLCTEVPILDALLIAATVTVLLNLLVIFKGNEVAA